MIAICNQSWKTYVAFLAASRRLGAVVSEDPEFWAFSISAAQRDAPTIIYQQESYVVYFMISLPVFVKVKNTPAKGTSSSKVATVPKLLPVNICHDRHYTRDDHVRGVWSNVFFQVLLTRAL